MKVLLVYSPAPRQLREWRLELPEAGRAGEALALCGLFQEFPDLDPANISLGVWGKRVAPAHVLREDDRVEVYRGLLVDPKVARRERFRRQGAKGTGLFAQKRAGAKAGY